MYNLIFRILLITIVVALTSCSKEEANYAVNFYDVNDLEVNDKTIPVDLNSLYSTRIEILTRAGSNPRFFINSKNVTDSNERVLKKETFSENYSQTSQLDILLNEADYNVGDLVEVSVKYGNANGDSEESFYLEVN